MEFIFWAFTGLADAAQYLGRIQGAWFYGCSGPWAVFVELGSGPEIIRAEF